MTDGPNWNAWFSRLRLGKWMDNGATAWLPFHGQHIFIAGETGYGKSNTERVILKELWPGIRAGAVEVIGFDAQLGVELQEVQDAGLLKEFYWGKGRGQKSTEYPDGKPYEATFAEALEKHVEEGLDRTEYMRKMGIKEWELTATDPGRVVLIDEAGQLFRENVAPKVKNRVIAAVDTMTYQFRKCGYVVVACTQHSNLKQIPIRHGLTFGVAHRMKTTAAYGQVLTGEPGFMPHLPRGVPDMAGLAYMSGQGKRILRTQYIPKLERFREPVIVNSARMPAYDPGPVLESVPVYQPVPVYQSHVGVVDTFSGEVLDPDDAYVGYR